MARRGADTSMQDVAGAAGMAASSLCEHFRGKDDLFLALHAELWHAFAGTLAEPVPAGLSRRHALELLVSHQLRVAAAWRDTLLVFPVVAACPRLAQAVRSGAERYLLALATWLYRHTGVARADAADAAAVVAGIIHAFTQRWLRRGARGDPSVLAPRVAHYVTAALA
ncbi:MAG: TetR family transcriptional regulator [Kofleriaceae bacterium]|nr:TetR family transcriptional regulator [Kofleriaceae bacterium]